MLEGPKNLPELLGELEEKSAETPSDLNLLRKLGRLHVRNGSFAAAVRAFRRVINLCPDDLQTTVDLGLSLARLGHLDEARFVLEGALEMNPQSSNVLIACSRLYEMLGNTELRVTFLMRAANATPKRPEIRLALGDLLRSLGDFGGAIKQFETILETFPQLEAARFGLASLLIRQGRLNEAMQHLLAITRNNASAHDAYFNLGHCLFRQGKYSLAVPSFLVALKGLKDHPQLLYMLAQSYFHLGDWDRSIVYMERFAAIQPASFETQLALGDLYMKTGEIDQARETFTALADQHPERPESFLRLAIALKDLKRYAQAGDILRRFFSFHPGNIEGHRLLADVHVATGQWKSALDEYRNTILTNETYLPGLRGV
ncbi:hypothetical protein AUK22_09375, partial [bacterium CG2_30_54_10]